MSSSTHRPRPPKSQRSTRAATPSSGASAGRQHHQQAPHAISASKPSVRINKALADAGVCSRRKAEELIAQGQVKLNGEVVTELSCQVAPGDVLEVQGKKINRHDSRCYLLLHKPPQVVCTASDPDGRATIFDKLPKEWLGQRLFSVGRLDYFSEGLLILTNDGDLAQILAHPRHHLPKIYHVSLREPVTKEALERMRRGMRLAEGEVLAPVEAMVLPSRDGRTILRLTLHQGINRQIRRMCRDLGLTILKLVRVSQGPLQLGDLAPGAVRPLSEQEVALLRDAALKAGRGTKPPRQGQGAGTRQDRKPRFAPQNAKPRSSRS